MNSYYNIFVGTENGLLKGINSNTRSFNNLNNLDNLTKEKEIVAMCWSNKTKYESIYFVTRDQHIVRYDTDRNLEAPFNVIGAVDAGKGLIIGLEVISNEKLLTCTENGSVRIWKISVDGEKAPSLESEFNVGSNISCIKKSPFDDNIIATGGKDNDLKVWNISNEPEKRNVFRAKNVADNWVLLREPVWVMCIDFLSENKIVIGTAHHQIRVYDIKGTVRRPVYNMIFGLKPITSVVVVPDGSNHVIATNTHGDMQMVDLNVTSDKSGQSRTIKKYKGFQGTIKSTQIIRQVKENKTNILVATCGLDRYLRIHNVETSQLVSKVYLKSRLNYLLYSANEPIKPPQSNNENVNKKLEDDELSNINSEDLGTDDLWSDMETIQDEYPGLKRKINKNGDASKSRLKDFDSLDESECNKDEPEFKKPKALPPLSVKNKKLKNKVVE